jgi:hypothetical protein
MRKIKIMIYLDGKNEMAMRLSNNQILKYPVKAGWQKGVNIYRPSPQSSDISQRVTRIPGTRMHAAVVVNPNQERRNIWIISCDPNRLQKNWASRK